MKKIITSAFTLFLLATMSCKNEKTDSDSSDSSDDVVNEVETVVAPKKESNEIIKMEIPLTSKSGSNVKGTVVISEEKGQVLFEANLTGLTPGMHAIHLHEKADCSSDDGKSSGGHWNPTFKPHGKWGSQAGYHKGDIGNFKVSEDGLGSISMITDEWCVGCGDETKDITGKAIIVHQGTDDYTSQPSGAAGKRVSCGGIIK